MLILVLQKNKRTFYSYSLLLYNKGKRRCLRKLGVFYFDFNLNKFILKFDFYVFMILCFFSKILISKLLYIVIYKYASIFKL